MSDNLSNEELASRIREVEAKAEHMATVGSGMPMSTGRAGFDFAISVFGGILLGWLVDLAVPSLAPWPIIVLAILGFLSGLAHVWRALQVKDVEIKDKDR